MAANPHTPGPMKPSDEEVQAKLWVSVKRVLSGVWNKLSWSGAGSLTLLIVLLILVAAPIGAILWGALHTGLPGSNDTAWTFEKIRAVYTTSSYLIPLKNTLVLAGTVATISGAVGMLLAWIYVTVDVGRKELLYTCLTLPLFISPFVGAMAWVTLAMPGAGLLNQLLRYLGLGEVNIYSFGGIVFTMAIYFTPYAFTFLADALARLNSDLSDAASVSGGSSLQILRYVTIPLLGPALLSVFLLIFTLSAEMFSIPGLLGAPQRYFTLSFVIYRNVSHFPLDLSKAAAAATLILLLTGIGVVMYQRLTRVHERFVTLGGKSYRPKERTLRPIVRWSLVGGLSAYILVTSILPIMALFIRTFLPYFGKELNLKTMGLTNYRMVLGDPAITKALVNSLMLSFSSALALVILGTTIAYLTIRQRGLMSKVIGILSTLPIAIPGTLFGVALVWMYIRTPLYGTLTIIGLAIVARVLPVVLRILQTTVMQISVELEEAATVSGASTYHKIRHIMLPLYRPSMLAAATLGFMSAFKELTASVLLFTSSSTVLPVMTWSLMFDGSYGMASVIAVLQVVVLGMVTWLFRLISRSDRNLKTLGASADFSRTGAGG